MKKREKREGRLGDSIPLQKGDITLLPKLSKTHSRLFPMRRDIGRFGVAVVFLVAPLVLFTLSVSTSSDGRIIPPM